MGWPDSGRHILAAGSGPASTFEFAVSAAASIGVHLSGEGFRARLITDAGEIAPPGTLEDILLDMLAVITPSRTAEVLWAAGWGVAVASASTPLAAAWQQMHRPSRPSCRLNRPTDR